MNTWLTFQEVTPGCIDFRTRRTVVRTIDHESGVKAYTLIPYCLLCRCFA